MLHLFHQRIVATWKFALRTAVRPLYTSVKRALDQESMSTIPSVWEGKSTSYL